MNSLHSMHSYLFQLDGVSELPAEGEMRDGDVVQDESELLCPAHQLLPHGGAEGLPLGDQLASVELRHHGLEHLVSDARQHALVIILPQRRVDVRQGRGQGSERRNVSIRDSDTLSIVLVTCIEF